jgi:recombination protein RecA
MFGKGISGSASLLDGALKYDLLQKSGSWYSYGEERIGQGRENAKQFLESNPDITTAIEAQLRDKMFAHLNPPEEVDEPAKEESGTKKEQKKSTAAAKTEGAESGEELF